MKNKPTNIASSLSELEQRMNDLKAELDAERRKGWFDLRLGKAIDFSKRPKPPIDK